MQVLQNAQHSEGSLQVESSRKTGVLVYKSSWVTLSVTSRREISRRDVKISSLCHVATWNSHFATSFFEALYHVATWNSHVATWNSHVATSLLHVATSFGHLLCHVTTWPRTSRRHLVMSSATSRRGILTSRRELVCSLSRRDVTAHVATWPCF